MHSANVSGIGNGLNGLIFAPPVLPSGTRPNAVFVAAPASRKSCPNTSLKFLCAKPQRNICQCTRTCCAVALCPNTCARSKNLKAVSGWPFARACAADCSSADTNGAMARLKLFMCYFEKLMGMAMIRCACSKKTDPCIRPVFCNYTVGLALNDGSHGDGGDARHAIGSDAFVDTPDNYFGDCTDRNCGSVVHSCSDYYGDHEYSHCRHNNLIVDHASYARQC